MFTYCVKTVIVQLGVIDNSSGETEWWVREMHIKFWTEFTFDGNYVYCSCGMRVATRLSEKPMFIFKK